MLSRNSLLYSSLLALLSFVALTSYAYAQSPGRNWRRKRNRSTA